jgi:hypothetical protein
LDAATNQDFVHIGHFMGSLIDEDKRSRGDNPVDGLTFDGVESKSHETSTDADISACFLSREYMKQLKDGEHARHFIPLMLLYSALDVRKSQTWPCPTAVEIQDFAMAAYERLKRLGTASCLPYVLASSSLLKTIDQPSDFAFRQPHSAKFRPIT